MQWTFISIVHRQYYKSIEMSGVCRHSNKHTACSYRQCNVRSKIWWFTRICRSHYVSHFAAFFIVVGAKTSVAESRMAFASYAKGQLYRSKTAAPSFLYLICCCCCNGSVVVCIVVTLYINSNIKCQNYTLKHILYIFTVIDRGRSVGDQR